MLIGVDRGLGQRAKEDWPIKAIGGGGEMMAACIKNNIL
jgi:hypothetical protein